MGKTSGRTVAIGIQDFGDLIRKGYFYIDKTEFIREWWNRGDSVTLITRPRRFGKTLNMSMLDRKSTRLNSSHHTKSRMPSSA